MKCRIRSVSLNAKVGKWKNAKFWNGTDEEEIHRLARTDRDVKNVQHRISLRSTSYAEQAKEYPMMK